MTLPMEAKTLLPHRGQMLLIDSVLSADEDGGTVLTDLSTQSIGLGPDGNMLPPFYIELVAQAYAAVCGYHLQNTGQPIPEGFLVGVQKFQINPLPSRTDFNSTELLIEVRTIGDFDGFAVVEGNVSREDIILAEGRIKLFIPQDESMAELIKQQKSGENTASWQP
ncbi:3-hydroxylacyl-ACP dehydratase [Maridesulfovibrio sp.]|uniref:3-hydroxylacyl-ACP dehydratase n=1 Tax=unclassified Maridesulfovibrio TaxID=2794999 RepID=UPI003AFFF6C6